MQDLHGVSKGVEISSKSLTRFKGCKHPLQKLQNQLADRGAAQAWTSLVRRI